MKKICAIYIKRKLDNRKFYLILNIICFILKIYIKLKNENQKIIIISIFIVYIKLR